MQDTLWCRNDCEGEIVLNRHLGPIRPIISAKAIAREGGLSVIASDVLISFDSSKLGADVIYI